MIFKDVDNFNFSILNYEINDKEIRFIVKDIAKEYKVSFLYNKLTCSCSSSNKQIICKHIAYILYYIVKDLKLIHKINLRSILSIYNLTNGQIGTIIEKNIIEKDRNLSSDNKIKENCPICLKNIKKLHIKCSQCSYKFHVNCVTCSKTNKCSCCRYELNFNILIIN